MAASSQSSHAIALWLSNYWAFHKTPQFLDYLSDTYGVSLDHAPSFECIYIAEGEEGDVGTGTIGGIIKTWWRVDDSGLVEILKMKPFIYDDVMLFDQRPILKFFTSGDRVVFGERFGKGMICRKSGQIVSVDGKVSVSDIRTIWASND